MYDEHLIEPLHHTFPVLYEGSVPRCVLPTETVNNANCGQADAVVPNMGIRHEQKMAHTDAELQSALAATSVAMQRAAEMTNEKVSHSCCVA